MKKNNVGKKALAFITALLITTSILLAPAFAANDITVYIDIEGFTLGQGYYAEPRVYKVPQGTTAADITIKIFNDEGIQSRYSLQGTSFYLSSLKVDKGFVNPPSFITKVLTPQPAGSWLGEIDYGAGSSWMLSVNHSIINAGAGDWVLSDGDVVRWLYTVEYGADLGIPSYYGPPSYNQQDKTELIRSLFIEDASDAAKASALGVIINPLASAAEVSQAIEALKAPQPEDKPEVILTAPSEISSDANTEFTAVVSLNAWADANVVRGIINVPAGVSVIGMEALAPISGGALDYNLDSIGKLRFAYLSQDLSGISFAQTPPTQAFKIYFKLNSGLNEGDELMFSVDSLSSQEKSSDPEKIFDVSKATAKVTLKAGVSASARVLYTGDGIDLIPNTQMAVAVSFANLNLPSSLAFGDSPMFYSSEMSDSVPTYVMIVKKETALETLNTVSSYAIASSAPEEIIFGDTDNNKTINSQDALNILSDWLRKNPAPNDLRILIDNVTSDSRIDTVDALAVVENFVNNTPFAVLN